MPLIIYTTAPNKKEAKNLAKKLCKRNLAACVQISKIRSVYVWQNVLQDEKELSLTIKTTQRFYKKICKFLRKHHSYEVPEIIAIKPRKVEKHYKKWLEEVLQRYSS